MSWNAAKRLRSWGYRNVHWFAEGADGWTDINRPLTVLQPYTPPKEH
jgi:rhodanese-related sulfurtransferase